MKKFIMLLLFVASLLTSSTIMAHGIASESNLAVINQNTEIMSYYSLEQKIDELAQEICELKQLQKQSRAQAKTVTSTLTTLRNLFHFLKEAATIGAIAVVIITGGVIFAKCYRLSLSMVDATKDAWNKATEIVAECTQQIPAEIAQLPEKLKEAYEEEKANGFKGNFNDWLITDNPIGGLYW